MADSLGVELVKKAVGGDKEEKRRFPVADVGPLCQFGVRNDERAQMQVTNGARNCQLTVDTPHTVDQVNESSVFLDSGLFARLVGSVEGVEEVGAQQWGFGATKASIGATCGDTARW